MRNVRTHGVRTMCIVRRYIKYAHCPYCAYCAYAHCAYACSVFFFPVNLKKVPVNLKRRNCPWTLKVPVNVFQKKCPWTYRNCPWTPKICEIWHFFRKKCPWIAKSTREHLPKFCSWTKKKCPWIGPLKCPWTQKSAREQTRKNEVHGHFWCSREKKTLYACGYLREFARAYACAYFFCFNEL